MRGMKFLHTMLRIKDLDVSLKFYTDILGLTEISRQSSTRGRYTLIFLATPADIVAFNNPPTIELTYNWEAEDYTIGRNFGHIAFEVENIYTYCTHLQNHNITINRPPRDGRMAFIKSPDMISIELLQAGDALAITEPWCDMPNIGNW
jgi:lactoylglutathione lyase